MTNKNTGRRYSEEIKVQAFKLLSEGKPMRTVAETLGVSEQTLTNWKKAAGMTKGRKPMKGAKQRIAKKDSQPAAQRTTQEKKSAGLGDLFQEYLAKEEELAAIKKAIAERL